MTREKCLIILAACTGWNASWAFASLVYGHFFLSMLAVVVAAMTGYFFKLTYRSRP